MFLAFGSSFSAGVKYSAGDIYTGDYTYPFWVEDKGPVPLRRFQTNNTVDSGLTYAVPQYNP